MSACFLDTSAVVDLLRARPGVLAASTPFDTFLLSFAVWGELVSGAHKTRDPDAELARLERSVAKARMIGANRETASIYGELLGTLESQGRRIPTNDLWIAATAVQFDLPLLARDDHFSRLQRLRWVAY